MRRGSPLIAAVAVSAAATLGMTAGGGEPNAARAAAPAASDAGAPTDTPGYTLVRPPATRERSKPANRRTGSSTRRPASPLGASYVPISLRVFTTAKKARRVAGLRVELIAPVTGATLGAGTSDSRGVCRIELRASAVPLDEGGLPLVRGRIATHGYQQRKGSRWRRRGESSFDLRLEAERGGTLRGRVVDSRGRGARFLLAARDEVTGDRLAHGYSETDGTFELHYERRAHAVVSASRAGIGSGKAFAYLPTHERPRDIEIVALGQGIVRGRVTDHRGDPANGMTLHVVDMLCADDEPDHYAYPCCQEHPGCEDSGQGFCSAEVRTDTEGRFEARGLRPGLYWVWGATYRGASDTRRITVSPVPADGAALELAVDRTCIDVVIDAKRSAAAASAGSLDTSSEIELFERDERGIAGRRRPGVRLDANRWLFSVPGGDYFVHGKGPRLGHWVRSVVVQPASGRNVVVVRPPDRVERGLVRVEVVDSHGEAISSKRLYVYVQDPTTALRVASAERRADTPCRLTVPAGRYRVVVEDPPSSAGCLGTDRRYGRAEELVDVQPQRTRDVRLQLSTGGWLDVSISGRPDETDAGAVYAVFGHLERTVPDAERLAREVTLELHRAGRAAEPLWRRSGRGTDWLLGASGVSDMVPAGTYELVGRLPGGRVAREHVVVDAGTTTRAELRFRSALESPHAK